MRNVVSLKGANVRGRNFLGMVSFLVATVVLVLMTAFCIAGTVMSKGDISNAELENYYREQEKELLSQTKEVLEELGYKNSGVTLTRVVDGEGNREYTFTIHHGKIDKLSEEERYALVELLAYEAGLGENQCADFTGLSNCSFYHEFLMYE